MKTPIRNRAWAAMLPALALLAACSQDDGFTNSDAPTAVSFTAAIAPAPGAPGTRTLTSGSGAPGAPGTTGTGTLGEAAPGTRAALGGASDASGTSGAPAPAPATRTTEGGDSWTTSDRVGIFMIAANGNITAPGDRLADNVMYNVSNAATGELYPDGGMPLYYPQTGNVDFVAYHPWRTTPGTIPYIYKVSVADQTIPETIDVLYAKTTNVAKSQTAVGLAFDHLLSKITLNVTLAEGLTGDVTAVGFSGMPGAAAIDLQDGSLTEDAAADFAALKAATASGSADATFTALLVPQPTGGAGRTAVFTVGGQTYEWNIPDATAFDSGKHHIYPVTIKPLGITVGAPTIADWTTHDNGAEMAKTLDMVWIKAGTFLMGSPEGESDREDRETQHWVTLSKDFYMSRYEITNAQYAAFLNAKGVAYEDVLANGLVHPGGKCTWGENNGQTMVIVDNVGVTYADGAWKVQVGCDNIPIGCVTWYGAYEYAKWIGGTLPTEAQWEYACRGGTTTAFYFGDDAAQIGDYGWAPDVGGRTIPRPVGERLPNAYGLYDMHGNVSEWCLDSWDHFDYGSEPVTDPVSPNPGPFRVRRGGSYRGYLSECRSAYRIGGTPDHALEETGLRVVFVP